MNTAGKEPLSIPPPVKSLSIGRVTVQPPGGGKRSRPPYAEPTRLESVPPGCEKWSQFERRKAEPWCHSPGSAYLSLCRVFEGSIPNRYYFPVAVEFGSIRRVLD